MVTTPLKPDGKETTGENEGTGRDAEGTSGLGARALDTGVPIHATELTARGMRSVALGRLQSTETIALPQRTVTAVRLRTLGFQNVNVCSVTSRSGVSAMQNWMVIINSAAGLQRELFFTRTGAVGFARANRTSSNSYKVYQWIEDFDARGGAWVHIS